MPDVTRFSMFNTKEKKSDRSPDMSGEIEIPASMIAEIRNHLSSPAVMNWKDEPVIKLRIAGWHAESQKGTKYINGLISVPQEQQEQAL